ncbi:MAG TPA: WD40 repeat domain-containing protein [Acidimicrobiia bacterium]|nr:WD40 repeat domain-containing protein [Acidimicrobiia bacterium]
MGSGVDGPVVASLGDRFALSPDGLFLAVPTGSTVAIYQWGGDHVGDLFATATVVGVANRVAWGPLGDVLVVAHDTSPFVSAFAWSVGGLGGQFADPGTLPTGNGKSVAFSPAEDYVAVGHDTSPFVSVYPWAAGFGAKEADPASLPGASCYAVAWNPTGSHLMTVWVGDPGLAVYPWSAGFGVKIADPATTANQAGLGAQWSIDGRYIGIADGNVTLGCHFYPFSTAAVIGNVETLSLGGDYADDLAFSPDGAFVILNIAAAPYLPVYRYSPAGPATYAPLNDITDLGGAPSDHLVGWGPTGGGSTMAVHPVFAEVAPYSPASPDNWTTVPVNVAQALDLLASDVAALQVLIDYIIAQTGITPPSVAEQTQVISVEDEDESPTEDEGGTIGPLV